MIATPRGQGLARFLERLRALFNLNDPGWGRDAGGRSDEANASGNDQNHNGQSSGDQPPDAAPPSSASPPPLAPPPPADRGQRPQGGPRPKHGEQQPPDLGELMGDLNRKLSGLFGGGGGNRNSGGGNKRGGMPSFKPPAISAALVLGVLAVVAVLWLASGFFVVQEGHRAVVLQFGKYSRSVDAGLNYHLPAPIGRSELVDMRIKSLSVGSGDTLIKETGLTQHAMLTRDENIIEVVFTVQYRVVNAENWLFNAVGQESTLQGVAESAVRQIVGNMTMDDALAIRREEIAPTLRRLAQGIVDRYGLGVTIVAINMDNRGVRPPDAVRDAYEDVLRAEQERVRQVNEATAYRNDVVPRAEGQADRDREDAEGYRLRVIAESQGDAERFLAVQQEYARAPQVTRERMFLETMEEVYRNSNKVLVDDTGGSSLMYLPLDKLIEQGAAAARNPEAPEAVSSVAPVQSGATPPQAGSAATQATRRPTREAR